MNHKYFQENILWILTNRKFLENIERRLEIFNKNLTKTQIWEFNEKLEVLKI